MKLFKRNKDLIPKSSNGLFFLCAKYVISMKPADVKAQHKVVVPFRDFLEGSRLKKGKLLYNILFDLLEKKFGHFENPIVGRRKPSK